MAQLTPAQKVIQEGAKAFDFGLAFSAPFVIAALQLYSVVLHNTNPNYGMHRSRLIAQSVFTSINCFIILIGVTEK
jgi:hypothetical protein